jgi:hypothetical protein
MTLLLVRAIKANGTAFQRASKKSPLNTSDRGWEARDAVSDKPIHAVRDLSSEVGSLEAAGHSSDYSMLAEFIQLATSMDSGNGGNSCQTPAADLVCNSKTIFSVPLPYLGGL